MGARLSLVDHFNEVVEHLVKGGLSEAYPLTWPDGWKRVPYRTRSRFEVSGFRKARDFLLAEIKRMGGSAVDPVHKHRPA